MIVKSIIIFIVMLLCIDTIVLALAFTVYDRVKKTRKMLTVVENYKMNMWIMQNSVKRIYFIKMLNETNSVRKAFDETNSKSKEEILNILTK